MDPAPLPIDIDPGLAGELAEPFPPIANGFRAGYRVRFDEAGPDGAMRTSSLLRYAQDIAWRHSERTGFDRAWYAERGLGWVVRGVALELGAPVPMGHTLRLETAVIGHKRIWARRLCECRLVTGELAARVTTDWVLLDGRGRIQRIPEAFGLAFSNPELDEDILRVPKPQGPPATALDLSVRGRDLDPLDHVNNAVYLDWLWEARDAAGAAWTATPVAALDIEYLASAARGDTVTVAMHGTPAAWTAVIRGSSGVELVRAAGRAASEPRNPG
ncbi:MAG TPA: acyl-ACP thioesterase domain-containing protein [Candidatus Limnocylindrales bacterium]|nr:acyl-ACP thioesterase domain-containing protein [Candidatus Limnocylindrales bacterium]